MMTEGVGLVAPKPVMVALSRAEVAHVLRCVQQIDNLRNYSRRPDAWGRGYIKNPGFIGKCCELGLTSFINQHAGTSLSPDMAPRAKGDGGVDVLVCGLVLQVKGTANPRARLLIKRLDARRRLVPLNCDAFVFAIYNESRRQVLLRGWIWKRDAREFSRVERSPVDVHRNLNVPPERLSPMAHLLLEIDLRRTA